MTDAPRGPTTEAPALIAVPYECWCGHLYMAVVDADTYEPRDGLYGPCPDCGQVCAPGGVAYTPDAP